METATEYKHIVRDDAFFGCGALITGTGNSIRAMVEYIVPDKRVLVPIGGKG